MRKYSVISCDYSEASPIVKAYHRHAPNPPPRCQIKHAALCLYNGVIYGAILIGVPVSPYHNGVLELRRLVTTPQSFGAQGKLLEWAD